jgi:hypothetical protein
MAGRFAPLRILGVRKQAMFLTARLPTFDSRVVGNSLVAIGKLQPSSLSETYTVRVSYQVGQNPRVEVLSPELQPRGDEKIPHMYGQKRLCLYEPGLGYWTGEQQLADTIIPWASLWLFYYEIWHATGEWMGGGHEPIDEDEDISP